MSGPFDGVSETAKNLTKTKQPGLMLPAPRMPTDDDDRIAELMAKHGANPRASSPPRYHWRSLHQASFSMSPAEIEIALAASGLST